MKFEVVCIKLEGLLH